MADTERLMNKAQGDDIISALGTIAANILQVPSEKLIIDWSYTTLPTSGNDHTIYAIPTGDADDPWDFYVWNNTDEEWVQFDWTFAVDSALSTTSENPVQNKVVKGALDDKVDKVEGKGLSTNDYTDAEKALVATIPDKADSVDVAGTQTVSGNPLTLTDAAPINAESLVVELEPKQEGSGDPSPTNIRPITGYTECEVDDVGKNLWGGEKLADDIVAKVPQATKDITNKTVTYHASQVEGITLFNKFKENTRYTFYFSTSSSYTNMIVRYTNGTSDAIEPNTYKVTYENKTVSEIRGFWASGATILKYEECGIFEGVITASDFEPYHSSNATIQFGQTVYGGEVDFKTGVLTVDRSIVDIGTFEWNKDTTRTGVFYTGNVPMDVPYVGFAKVCSDFKVNNSASANSIANGELSSLNSYGSPRLFVKDTARAELSASEFQTAMNGVQLVYELATPFTIQLTPDELKLLKGTNNITTNGTTINLGYQPDNVIGEVKGEIEKCAVDAEFMQFTDGTDTFTDVNLSLDALSHTVSVVGSKIEQKRFICYEVMDKMGGVLQGILASCIAFTDGAKTPSGTAFRAYIDPVSMYVDLRICGSGGSYMLSYQSETSFSASAFYVRVRMMNNL